MIPLFYYWLTALAVLVALANWLLITRLAKAGVLFQSNLVPVATAFPLIVSAAALYWHDPRLVLIALTITSLGTVLIGMQRVDIPR